MSDLDLGLALVSGGVWLPSATALSFSRAGLAARRPPLLTYALDRRFRPVASSASLGNILESVRKERKISLMLMSSLAEHSSTFTLKEVGGSYSELFLSAFFVCFTIFSGVKNR